MEYPLLLQSDILPEFRFTAGDCVFSTDFMFSGFVHDATIAYF